MISLFLLFQDLQQLYVQNDFPSAEKVCLEYLDGIEDTGVLTLEMCQVFDCLINSAIKQKKNELSLLYIKKVEDYLKQVNSEQCVHECSELCKILGLAYKIILQQHKALEYMSLAYDYALRTNDVVLICDRAIQQGSLYYHRSDYQEALYFFKQALGYAIDMGDMQSEAYALGNLGSVYLSITEYSTALEYFTKALHKVQDSKDYQRQSLYLGNIGVVYLRLKEYDKAESYYKQALAIAEKNTLQPEIARHYGNLGNLSIIYKEYDKANEFYLRSLEISIQCGYHTGIRRMYGNLGSVYLSLENYTEADKCFKKALQLAEEQQSQYGIAMQYGNLAQMFSSHQWEGYNYDQALEYALQAEKIFLDLGTKHELVKLYELLALIYKNIEQWERHSHFLKLFYETQREIYIANAQQKLQNATIALMEQQQEILSRKNDTLEKLVKEKDEFLSIASHDLKNPLHSIQLITQYLLSYPNESHHEREQMYHDILTSSHKMFSIISEYLQAHRTETSETTLILQTKNVEELLTTCVHSFKAIAAKKNIVLTLLKENKPLWVWCDENKFIQVMDNLISNALKFSPFSSEITVSYSFQDERVRIEVRDQGPGLTLEDREKLFTKFSKLSAVPTNGESSTGLGLYIVNQLVQQMNGTIYCRSEFGHGCSFFVELYGSVIE